MYALKQAGRVLRTYNGITKDNFPPLLEECAFRFNFGTHEPPPKTLKERAGTWSCLLQPLGLLFAGIRD